MSKEDELVNALIRRTKDGGYSNDKRIEPEAHYNDYGTRGVADLFVRDRIQAEYTKHSIDHVYEVKSSAAVDASTGANAVLRQFNKMRRSFYNDESYSRPYETLFELCFTIEPATVLHVANNLQMYTTAQESQLYDGAKERVGSKVFFRSAREGENTPVHLKNAYGKDPETVGDWATGLSNRSSNPATGRVLAMLRDQYDLDVNLDS